LKSRRFKLYFGDKEVKHFFFFQLALTFDDSDLGENIDVVGNVDADENVDVDENVEVDDNVDVVENVMDIRARRKKIKEEFDLGKSSKVFLHNCSK
jgi:hypothetical protein